MPSPIPSQVNADLRTLTDLLCVASVGDVVSYADMSAAIGSDIRIRPWLVPRAVVLANRDQGALFACINGIGQKRLSAAEAHLLGHAVRRRIGRASRRTAKLITRGMEVANDIPAEAKRKAYAELNTLGLLAHISRDRVTAATASDDKPMPIAQVMRATMAQLGVVMEPTAV